jgi:hypothetical protein
MANVDYIADGDITKLLIGLTKQTCGKTTPVSNRTWLGLVVMPPSAIQPNSGVIARDRVGENQPSLKTGPVIFLEYAFPGAFSIQSGFLALRILVP